MPDLEENLEEEEVTDLSEEEVPEEVEEAPEPEKEPEPEPSFPEPARVPLRVFIASSGVKWDQMAGFKAYAKRTNLGPLSITDWRKAFTDFQKRPVR